MKIKIVILQSSNDIIEGHFPYHRNDQLETWHYMKLKGCLLDYRLLEEENFNKRYLYSRVCIVNNLTDALAWSPSMPKEVINLPQIKVEGVNLLSILGEIYDKDFANNILTLKGHTIITGKSRGSYLFKEMLLKLLEYFQWVKPKSQSLLELYYKNEIGIEELSEIEDVLTEYLPEGAKLHIQTYAMTRPTQDLYYIFKIKNL